ncbi:MAG: beta-N-acetylhexosaminidase [Acidobacteriota bacterium]|nr:beta-N-acetylhexosaminidase [Acidobacteriota bacterium]
MNLESQLSRTLFAGVGGPDLTTAEIAALGDLRPGGVTLFGRNLRSLAQLRDLVCALEECAGRPLVVAIDLEGGRVHRLTAIDPRLAALPAAREQARWSLNRLERTWEAVGVLLASVGIDLDFAPVVDLDEGLAANGIGDRAFDSDPDRVVVRARAVIEGLARAGRASCLKHFPGLGGTRTDTHRALAVSPHDAGELWERHVHPYRELTALAPAVMTAHAAYPCLEEPRLPGSLSASIVTGWLRERLGYQGVVFSDDLGMGALAGCGDDGDRALAVLAAGADVALFCHDLDAPRRARDCLFRAIARGALDPSRLSRSAARVEKLADRPPATVGAEAALESLVETLLHPLDP